MPWIDPISGMTVRTTNHRLRNQVSHLWFCQKWAPSSARMQIWLPGLSFHRQSCSLSSASRCLIMAQKPLTFKILCVWNLVSQKNHEMQPMGISDRCPRRAHQWPVCCPAVCFFAEMQEKLTRCWAWEYWSTSGGVWQPLNFIPL